MSVVIVRTLFFIMIASVLGGVLYIVKNDLTGSDLIINSLVICLNCYYASAFFDPAFPKEKEKE